MNQVSISELSRQTARVMARVEAGETVEITRRGKVIGRIVPVRSRQGRSSQPLAPTDQG